MKNGVLFYGFLILLNIAFYLWYPTGNWWNPASAGFIFGIAVGRSEKSGN